MGLLAKALACGSVVRWVLEEDDPEEDYPKMSSTTQKHRNFVAEPMGDKPVTDLAGIAQVNGKKLVKSGFDKAYIVLGQFLLLKKDKELFVEWLQDLIGCNVKQATDCWQCLSDWCAEFL